MAHEWVSHTRWMRGVGQPIWHVAGQEPVWMMNGGSCADCDVSDTNLQVEYISLQQCTLPLKQPSGALSNSASHKHQLHLIISLRWGRRQRQSGCCFFFFLISAVTIGVRVARPSPQDPAPSAPATASTSVAAMHDAHNLQDVSLYWCVCVCSRSCVYLLCAHALLCGYVCLRVCSRCGSHAWSSQFETLLLVALARSSETNIHSIHWHERMNSREDIFWWD